MKYLIHKNVKLPLIGFGTWTLGDNPSLECQEVDTMVYGVNNFDMFLIDTAEMYGLGKSEKVVAKALKKLPREKIFIVDKILPSSAKKGQYVESCRKSLSLLGIEYIDLYLLHWRSDVDLQDMVNHMEELVSMGLIKRWGVSNFDVKDMEELFKCKNGKNCFANQVLYNIAARGIEYDLLPWCKEHDVLFMAYSPLLSNRDECVEVGQKQEIKNIYRSENKTLESLLLSFVIRNEDIVTIFKTSNIGHLEGNMKNVFNPPSKESMDIIETIYPHPDKKQRLLKI